MATTTEYLQDFEKLTDDRERIHAIFEYCLPNRNAEPAKCRALGEYILELSTEIDYPLGRAFGLLHVGFQNWQTSYIETALDQLAESWQIINDLEAYKHAADVRAIQAMAIWGTGDYEQAIAIVYDTHSLLNSVGEDHRLSWLYWTLGVFYYDLKDYDKSVLNYQKALKKKEQEGDTEDYGFYGYTYIGLGANARLKGDTETARSYIQKAREASEAIGHWMQSARTFFEEGCILMAEGKLEEAEKALLQSYEMRKQHNAKPGMVSCLLLLADMSCDRTEHDQTVAYLQEALALAEETNTKPKIYQCHEKFAQFYRDIGEFEMAFHHIEKFYQLKSEIEGDVARNKMQKMASRYESERNEREKEINRLRHVELKEAHDNIAEINREVFASIQYASKIQRSLLPPKERFDDLLGEHFVFFRPRDVVTGDFYWIYEIGQEIYFAVADCTGHGVPGAMVSVMCINCLNKAVERNYLNGPAAVLDHTVQLLSERFSHGDKERQEGMDIALCAYNPKTAKVRFAGANNPMYYTVNGVLTEIKADKQPVGHYVNRVPFTQHEIDILDGDCVFLFSDGFADQFGGPNFKKFKYEPFKRLLEENVNRPMEDQLTELTAVFEEWIGPHEQTDDICVLGVRKEKNLDA